VIDGFKNQGFKKFWLCVNYRKECIEDYFKDGAGRGINIRYTHELEALGTAGALALLPKFKVPFIVQNSDVIASVSYAALMEHHARANCQATVCLSLYQHQIPYGVAQTEENLFKGVREKPIEDFPVIAGIYVLEPSVVDLVPRGARLDMPDLLLKLDKVSVFAIEGWWVDVGRFSDYLKANGGMV